MPAPSRDNLERVYAGVLGKLIGVYLGRPFEGWTHQRILEELGHVEYYVHERFDMPLVVTDDDVSGTFVFPRALLEHGVSSEISSENIGDTWLNNVVEGRSIFWWGGNGISTEHTAFLNLKKGVTAPRSGSIEKNGKTVAEQIGAQIFIDGWGMIARGNPVLAAKLAEKAGKVSHDGESVYAAMLLAAMEAEAFNSKDVNHLLDTGLGFIPTTSELAKMIFEIRQWHASDNDWMKTRQRIEDKYGYQHYCGNCHVMPNHGIMVLSLLYGGHSFHEAMHIINTCGWDTDCNSGNIACLVALMHGMESFKEGPDWRGPLADRALISSADGGYSINNAARIAYDLANMGQQLAGEKMYAPPKDGAQFHFDLPGSVQGFMTTQHSLTPHLVGVAQGIADDGRSGLAIRLNGLTKALKEVEILSQTFTPPEIVKMKTYDLMASPLIYPGQTLKSLIRAEKGNSTSVDVQLRLKVYGRNDILVKADGPCVSIIPGTEQTLEWTIPDKMDSQPIQQLGLALSAPSGYLEGTIWVDHIRWEGTPCLTLRRPQEGPSEFWRRAWVNGVSRMQRWNHGPSFYIAQDDGEGIISYGTREWRNYTVTVSRFRINLGGPNGIVIRVQGLRRWYALLLTSGARVTFVRSFDRSKEELASASFDWKMDESYDIAITVVGGKFIGKIDGQRILEATDDRFEDGGVGLVVTNGSLSAEEIKIEPASSG